MMISLWTVREVQSIVMLTRLVVLAILALLGLQTCILGVRPDDATPADRLPGIFAGRRVLRRGQGGGHCQA